MDWRVTNLDCKVSEDNLSDVVYQCHWRCSATEVDGDKTGIAFEIKQYLLAIIEDDKNDLEKFSDARIEQAERILDRAGPSAMYWMTDIAAQLAFLAAAKANGIPTNVDAKVGEQATPEAIVKAVVKG
jgi:hypothetical protein